MAAASAAERPRPGGPGRPAQTRRQAARRVERDPRRTAPAARPVRRGRRRRPRAGRRPPPRTGRRGRRTSGAPRTQAPAGAEVGPAPPAGGRERRPTSPAAHPAEPASARRWRRASGWGGPPPRRARPSASADRVAPPGAGRTRRPGRAMPPPVSVPVLSTQSTSTRARPSTAGSSWTSTRRPASRMTAMAKAMLVSRTSPSGIMAPTPATQPRMASARSECETSWLMIRSRPVPGRRAHWTSRRIWLTPSVSSERARREPAGLAGEVLGVGVGAHPGHPVARLTRADEAAGADLVAVRPGDGVGLAGQQRLVDLRRSVEHDPVEGDLVAP